MEALSPCEEVGAVGLKSSNQLAWTAKRGGQVTTVHLIRLNAQTN